MPNDLSKQRLARAAKQLTQEQAQEAKNAIARVSFQGFVSLIQAGYKMGWLHEEICRKLDEFLAQVEAGQSPRLILTVPPRHGKSTLVSRCFPAYVFGRDPDLSIIATSYSADLASRMNRDVQRIIDTDEYRAVFPDTTLAKSSGRTDSSGRYTRTSDLFEIVGHKGSYRSAGVGGGITGMGGSVIVIDDPLKDRADADSPTIRQKLWDWYTSTLYTRLAPGGGIVLCTTRWSCDDLAGRLLEAQAAGNGDAWTVVNFPAIAEEDEPFRHKGEALHPGRFPLEQLLAIKKAIGTRDWEALYQQKPVPDGGAIFKQDWLHYYTPKDLPKRFEASCISWDMTFKDGSASDFVVGQVWGRAGGRFYLLDQVRGRWSFTETLDKFVQLAKKWPKVTRKLVEDKANGPAVIDALKTQISGIIPIEPDGSKTARAHAVTTLFEAGNVFLPSPQCSDWIPALQSELLQFPAGAHDDQVDAMTQALRDLETHKGYNLDPKLLLRRRML